MTCFERIDAAVNLRVADRVPVAPLIIGYAGSCAGVTQGEIYLDLGAWMRALAMTYGEIGECDAVFPRWPLDVANMQMMVCKIPGRDLDASSLVQVIEKELMDPDDYGRIASGGYAKWFFGHLARLWGIRVGFPLAMPRIIPRLLALNLRNARIGRYWSSRGVPTLFDSACYPPFDMFSLVRSMESFCYDLFDCPELIEAASRAAIGDIIKFAKMPLRFGPSGGPKRICIYPMRSSSSFISPEMFERFSLPFIKQIVEDFWGEGIVSVLHCDGDWTPMLKFFSAFPPKSCIIELDDRTDILAAKAALGDRLCLKGNLSSTLLAFGDREEVSARCETLAREVGKGGGYILSSGCEVPLNAKLENVKAIVEASRT